MWVYVRIIYIGIYIIETLGYFFRLLTYTNYSYVPIFNYFQSKFKI